MIMNQMQNNEIFNDKILKNFLTNIPVKDHLRTVKELIYIGINMVSGAMSNHQQNNYSNIHQTESNYIPQNNWHSSLLSEIENIKGRINEIVNLIYKNSPQFESYNDNKNPLQNHKENPTFIIQSQPLNKKILKTESDLNFQHKNWQNPTNDHLTPKVTEVCPQIDYTRCLSHVNAKGRRGQHLDDRQLKEVMVFPISPPKKKKKKEVTVQYPSYNISFNPSKNQNIHDQIDQKPIIAGGYTHLTSKQEVKSKIKSLIDRDKMNYQYDKINNLQRPEKDTQPYGFNKFQYVDEENQQPYIQNSKVSQEKQNYIHTKKQQIRQRPLSTMTFKKPSNKDNLFEFMEPAKESEREESIQDNSSSFSQFSLTSSKRRQAGKISRKR